jgi:hypothetical protein
LRAFGAVISAVSGEWIDAAIVLIILASGRVCDSVPAADRCIRVRPAALVGHGDDRGNYRDVCRYNRARQARDRVS